MNQQILGNLLVLSQDFALFFRLQAGDEYPDPVLMRIIWLLFSIAHSSAAAEEILLPIFRLDPDEIPSGSLPEVAAGSESLQGLWLQDKLEGLAQLQGLSVSA